MLDFKAIRLNGTTLENVVYDWLEENLADWEELSDGKRKYFFGFLRDQLELAAENGSENQSALITSSYSGNYNCPVDLRSYII